jgi:hypothetical protein
LKITTTRASLERLSGEKKYEVEKMKEMAKTLEEIS